jgi:hypothetical protein
MTLWIVIGVWALGYFMGRASGARRARAEQYRPVDRALEAEIDAIRTWKPLDR